MRTLLLSLIITFSAYGQSLNWAAKFSGSAHEMCSNAVTDAAGNVYAVGVFRSSVDFDPGPGFLYLNESNPNQGDMYCVKLNREGQLVWAKIVGGADGYSALEETTPTIALDAAGNVFVAGIYTNQTDMDPGPATLFLPPPSSTFSTGNFISKFDNSGNLIWAKAHGAPFGSMWNRQIKTDASGNVYLAGYFNYQMAFSGPEGTMTLATDPANFDGYVLKYDNDGNFLNALQIGSPVYNDYIRDIDVDPQGNIAVTGGYRGTVDFDPSANEHIRISISNSEDIFIAKFDTGLNLAWAHSFGRPNSTNADSGHAITFDNQGNVIGAGSFRTVADFNPSPDEEFMMQSVGTGSVYFLKLTPGGEFVWAKTIGAMSADGTVNHSEKVWDLDTDVDGNLYITGHYVSHMDADPSEAVHNLVANGGGTQALNMMLDHAGNFGWAKSYGAVSTNLSAEGRSIEVNTFGEVVVGGRFQGTVDFNPGGSPVTLSSSFSSYGSFLMSILPVSLANPQFTSERALVASPNPFEHSVGFSTGVLAVKLYDTAGRLIHSSNNIQMIDGRDIPPGVYLANVLTSSGSFSLRLIKK